MLGIDISKWQGSNYDRLIDDHAKDFVICRATFGRTVDPYCDKIYQYAKGRGKKLGFYMFPLTSEGAPRASAEWHYKQVTGYIKEAIPCIDWEVTNGTDISRVDWAYDFAKRFEELSGVKPVFYMNVSCEKSYDWSRVVANDNGLWIASWGANDGQDHGYPAPVHWKVVAIHQFTSKYAGLSLDADKFNGDAAAWDAYAGGSAESTPTPAPEPEPAPTPAPAVQTYTVKAGDTLSEIAARFGTTYQKIAADNGIADPNLIVVGQVLIINGSASNVRTYTVKAGDTLSGIAARFGTTWQHLQKINGIANANLIHVGDVIRIQ